jgi:hypothetical protein
MRVRSAPTAVLALSALAVLAGCSSGKREATNLTDHVAIQQILRSFGGSASDPRNVPTWFAQGAAPPAAEQSKYAKYSYRAEGDPTVSGDTATVKVKLRDAKSDNEAGIVEWTFVNEGGQWKIKSAPLP